MPPPALAPGRLARSVRAGAGLALAVLVLVVPSSAGATATQGPRTVDDLAASLRDDPILVDPTMGTGDADGVHDVLTDLAAQVDVPVYVVLAATPADLRTTEDPAQQAAALLNADLGDGLYVVHFTDGIGWVGGFGAAKDIDTTPGQRAATRAREIGPNEYNQVTAALDAELVLRAAADPGRAISDDRLRELIDTPYAFVPTGARERTDQLARRWVYTIAAALAVLVAGLCLSAVGRAAPMPSRRRTTTAPSSSRVLNPVDDETLIRAHRRFDGLAAADLASPHATAAQEALTAADLVASSGDRLDAVGAWVLAQQAGREIDRIRRPARPAYRPCVVNPEHGEASATVRLARTSIDAPACAACAHTPGTFLTAPTWGRDRSYLTTSTVWARTGFGALVDDLAGQVIADRDAR
jgi:hypothetical protein